MFSNKLTQTLLPTFATLTILAISTTLAAPPSNPPNGNVTPTFNGLSIRNGATETFRINPNGSILNPQSGTPLNIADIDGLTTTTFTGTAIRGTSGSGSGVAGISSTGVGVSGNSSSFTAVQGSSDSGTGIAGFSTNGDGVYAYSANATALRVLSNQTGVDSTASIAGNFKYNSVGGPSVQLGTATAAINATGPILSSTNIGRIYNLTDSTSTSIAAGTPASPAIRFAVKSCPAGDFILSCGISNTNGTTFLNDTTINSTSTSCTIYASNIGPAGNLRFTTTCFSPNG